jgi:transcriptional regulator with XRE-family HTH domain
MRINVTTIKKLMSKNGMSQVDLSQRTGLGVKTVGRACAGNELRTGNVEQIAKALRVTVAELTDPSSDPISDEVKKKPGLTKLVMDLDHTTMNKLQSAARRYQVQPKTIIKFAPLLFSLIAEASLAERTRHLRDWEAKMKNLIEAAPASSNIRADLETRTAEASKCEQASIDQRDLRGGFSSAREAETVQGRAGEGVTNPFLSFLKGLSGDQHFVIDNDSIDYLEYALESLVDFGEPDFRARTEIEEMANNAVYEESISLLDVPPELQQPHRAEDRTRWLASFLGGANGNFERARTVWQESGLEEQWLASNNLIRCNTVSRSEDTQDGAYEQTRS